MADECTANYWNEEACKQLPVVEYSVMCEHEHGGPEFACVSHLGNLEVGKVCLACSDLGHRCPMGTTVTRTLVLWAIQ